MPSKEETIYNTYFSDKGYGAISTLFRDAKKKDPSISFGDVKSWVSKNIVRTKNYKFQNSWVPKGPLEELQIDVFWYKFNQDERPPIRYFKGQRGKNVPKTAPYGLLAVDSFTKKCHVVPMNFKDADAIKTAMTEVLRVLGKPKVIYSDPDTSFLSDALQDMFRAGDITHMISRLHARVAERTIRTIKNELSKRIAFSKKKWTAELPAVLEKYNSEMKHSAIGMTPNEAAKVENEFEAKTNLEVRRKKHRAYPELEVGDKVRVYRKRGTFAKEETGVWDKDPTTITRIETSSVTGQKLYYVAKATIMSKPFIRSEIWLIDEKRENKPADEPKVNDEKEEDEDEEDEDDWEVHRYDWRGHPMYYKHLDVTGNPRKDKKKEERYAAQRMMQPFDPDIANKPGKRWEPPPPRKRT